MDWLLASLAPLPEPEICFVGGFEIDAKAVRLKLPELDHGLAQELRRLIELFEDLVWDLGRFPGQKRQFESSTLEEALQAATDGD